MAANVADLSMTSDDSYEAAHPVADGVSLKLGEELASVLRRRAPDGCSCTSTIEIVVVVPGTGKAPEIDSYP